jgi:hypothetical protein
LILDHPVGKGRPPPIDADFARMTGLDTHRMTGSSSISLPSQVVTIPPPHRPLVRREPVRHRAVRDLDVATGVFSSIPCGHPPPLLIRGNKVIKELARRFVIRHSHSGTPAPEMLRRLTRTITE